MKKRVTILRLLPLTILLNIGFKQFEASEIVRFSDPKLEACVAQQLEVDRDEINSDNIRELTTLTCSSSSITSLDGIEAAINLRYLTLNDNNISSVKQLSNLTQLSRLELRSNQIKDLTPLSELGNLQVLDLSSNQISDLSALENLTNLRNLRLNNNQISNIDSLGEMTNLTELLLNDNQLTSINAVSNMTQLKILSVNDNQLTSLEPLTTIQSLQSLNVINNQLTSLDGIENNRDLKSLKAERNKISDISAVSGMSKLQDINLSNNNISNIGSFELATDLQTLILDNNNINNIDIVTNFNNLLEFSAAENKIVDISSLSNLENIKIVDVSGNKISDISYLKDIKTLQALDIGENRITDLSPLKRLKISGTIDAENQDIMLEPISINDIQDVRYEVVDIDGTKEILSIPLMKPGKNNITVSWQDNGKTRGTYFSGTITQVVNYKPRDILTTNSQFVSNQGNSYTDKQLIEIFNVESSLDQTIAVDQEQVDYDVPGEYEITFVDEDGNQISSKFIVKDVLPSIEVKTENIYVPLNQTRLDYAQAFNVTATELSDGDLNEQLIIDDSQVNLYEVGHYPIKFTVQDGDGNLTSETVYINVVDMNSQFRVDNGGIIYMSVQSLQGGALPGYEYTIYDENGDVVDVIVTDENGHAESESLQEGSYSVKLTSTPEQKMIDENSNSTVTSQTGNGDDSHEDSTADVKNSYLYVDEEVSVENEKISTAVKTPEEKDFEITFSVFFENGEQVANELFLIKNEDNSIQMEIATDSNGFLVLTGLEAGQYQVTLADESNYSMKNDVSFDILEDGSTSTNSSIIVLEQHNSKDDLYKLMRIVIAVIVGLGLMLVYIRRRNGGN